MPDGASKTLKGHRRRADTGRVTSARRLKLGPWEAVGAAGLALLLLINLPEVSGEVDPVLGQWIWAVVAVLAGVRIVTRAAGPARLPWLLLGSGVIVWSAGSVTYAAFVAGQGAETYPSPADVLWLGAYPLFAAALLLLVKNDFRGRDPQMWLDGLVAGLGAAAVGSALVTRIHGADGDGMTVALIYPVFDLVLLGIAAAGSVVTARHLVPVWRRLAAGLLLLAAADTFYVTEVAAEVEALGGLGDLGWVAGFWVFAITAPPAATRAVAGDRTLRHVAVVPLLCSVVAIAVLLADHAAALPFAPVALALATLSLSVARTALALHANVRLQASADQAVRDELTGLWNRRRLLRDLDLVASERRGPATLALFDLDGFKAYNDAYGHPAGDGLLMTLGSQLARAVGEQGRAYRLGGDEFCVLIDACDVDHRLVLERAIEALREEGDGFSIGASYGRVSVPEEAATSSEALQLADTRMYACKDAGRASTRRQSRDLLLQLLHEQQPDLEEHSGDVGELVVAVGRRLGMSSDALDHARHAAELHDVGKVAIPAAILNKPGPLDDDEWALMKRHTIIGERILSSVPALVPVGRIVRATHERWDGDGYPDGLRGEEIPLGARVIAVCDSFHAITTDRPYRKGTSDEEALAELRRCAGTQFDADVVEAFALQLADGTLQAAGGADAIGDASQAVARRVAPAGAIAQHAAGELAQLAKLRGLLHATQMARGGADIADVLGAIGSTIGSSLGFRVVSINLFRPEWDDFICTAVQGDESVREQLLGHATPADSWLPLLQERFARNGAYFVPAGAVEFDDDIAWHVPDIEISEDPGAWHPDDMLVVPLRGNGDHVLGMVTVDEPVWGRRPSDAEIEVLVAVAEHAALALQSARSSAIGRAARAAGHRAADLGQELAAATTEAEVADAVERCVREALRFETVAVELVRAPLDAHMLDELLAGVDADGGTAVLAGEKAWKARAWRGSGGAQRNGHGSHAWHDHLLVAPVRGSGGELLAVVWCDDPADRLLPHASIQRTLRQIAAQAVVPLAWGRRAPAPTLQP